MIYILLILLVIMLIINFYIYEKDFIAPAFIFNASFTFSCFMVAIYANEINLGLHLNTFLVIFMGVLIFSIVCYFINKKYKKEKSKNININVIKEKNNIEEKINKRNKILKIIFFFASVLINIATIIFMLKVTNVNIMSLGDALYKYRNLTEFQGQDISMPFLLNVFTGILHAAAYWFLYKFIYIIIKEKKVDWISLLIIISCIISNLLEGSRGSAVNIALSGVAFFIFLRSRYSKYHNGLTIRNIIILLIICIVGLCNFKSFAQLIGRNDTKVISNMDYIEMYTGDPTINLDLFLQEDIEYQYGKNSFSYIYKYIQNIFGFSDNTASAPFRYSNGHNLGNVYTVFYTFISDYGYIGVLFGIIIMALISQIIYENSQRESHSKNIVYLIIYGYIFGGICLSFFSNRFYKAVFNLTFIKYIIVWIILTIIFSNEQYKDIIPKKIYNLIKKLKTKKVKDYEKEESIIVYIATHKMTEFPSNNIYRPIQVGTSINNNLEIENKDNVGKNISEKNKSFCELTAIYWIWKNSKANIVGLVHYRRYFFKKINQKNIINIIDKDDIKNYLYKYDVIVPKKEYIYKYNVIEQYSIKHNKEDFLECKKIIEEIYPQYIIAFDKVSKNKSEYLYNMFIMRKELLDEYAKWLFDILFELEKRIDIKKYDDYNKRVYGFISERLFNVWLEKNDNFKVKELYVNNIEDKPLKSNVKNIIKKILINIKNNKKE